MKRKSVGKLALTPTLSSRRGRTICRLPKTGDCAGRTTHHEPRTDDSHSLSHPMGEGQGEGTFILHFPKFPLLSSVICD